jgi:hypothetical protein
MVVLSLSLNGLGGEKVEVVKRWGGGWDSFTSMTLVLKIHKP